MARYVSFSGGKDSTALALLCPDATPIFSDTGWEFDEMYEFIDGFEKKTGREVIKIKNDDYPGGIPEYINHSKFLPNFHARWCTRMFKIEPFNDFLKEGDELLIGLRVDEKQRVGNTGLTGIHIRYPLQEMRYGLDDVLRLCLENGLLPRYPVYMMRGGCKGCFYKSKKEIEAMDALVPHVLDELQALEEGVQDERGRFFYIFPALGCSISNFRSQGVLFDTKPYFVESSMDTYCGLFCRK